MIRYWIGVASYEHVIKGREGGFAQVCHGKQGPLQKMKQGDWIIYYSPTFHYGVKDSCQQFTAIGKIDSGVPYLFEMSNDFTPWRRDVTFFPSRNASIKPLLDHLTFVTNKDKWGLPFRRGCFEISRQDFELIAHEMGGLDEVKF